MEKTLVIKDILQDKYTNIKLDEYHILTYVGIHLFYNPALEEINMNLDMLYDRSKITDKRTKNKIKQSLKDLSDLGLIKVDYNRILYNNTTVRIQENKDIRNTIKLNVNSVIKILDSEYQISKKGNILMAYILILKNAGNINPKELAENMDINIKTAKNIVSQLNKMSIL